MVDWQSLRETLDMGRQALQNARDSGMQDMGTPALSSSAPSRSTPKDMGTLALSLSATSRSSDVQFISVRKLGEIMEPTPQNINDMPNMQTPIQMSNPENGAQMANMQNMNQMQNFQNGTDAGAHFSSRQNGPPMPHMQNGTKMMTIQRANPMSHTQYGSQLTHIDGITYGRPVSAKSSGKGQQKMMCRYFALGTCSKGTSCTFLHELPFDPRMTGMSRYEQMQMQWAAEAAQRMASGEQLVCGKVRVFDAEKKHGYIMSEVIHAVSGQEVYVHENVLQLAAAGPGDTVLFFIHWSGKGLPQASAPLIRIASESFALKGVFVKSRGKEVGFIDCQLLQTLFGKNVSLDVDVANFLEAGTLMCFNAAVGKDRVPKFEFGRPCEPSWEPTASDVTRTRIDPNVRMLQVSTSRVERQLQTAELGGINNPTWAIYGGIVKSFSKANNYGFISCEPLRGQFGCDVHFSGNLFEDACVGDIVTFELSLATNMRAGGKLQARFVARADQLPYTRQVGRMDSGSSTMSSPAGMSSAGPMSSAGDMSSAGAVLSSDSRMLKRPCYTTGETKFGRVKSYNPQANYGFISSEEVKAQYGFDVYCPGEYLVNRQLGEAVMFEVAINKKGQPQAVDVRDLPSDMQAPPEEPPSKVRRFSDMSEMGRPQPQAAGFPSFQSQFQTY